MGTRAQNQVRILATVPLAEWRWDYSLASPSESPLDCKEIQPVHPKGDQSWVFIGRTDAEAETAVLWPPDVKSWLIWKDPDAGKDWGQEKGTTEDEMVGWHNRLNGHGFGWIPGVHGVANSLTWLNDWTELKYTLLDRYHRITSNSE